MSTPPEPSQPPAHLRPLTVAIPSTWTPEEALAVFELIDELRGRYAIIIVTHSMQQAARVSQRTAFFHLGHLVEYGETSQIFTTPREKRTQDYITGRYG